MIVGFHLYKCKPACRLLSFSRKSRHMVSVEIVCYLLINKGQSFFYKLRAHILVKETLNLLPLVF